MPFEIKLRLVQGPLFGCDSSACSDYGLGCGATLSIRVVDADSLDDVATGGDAGSPVKEYAKACVALEPADDLCALGEVDLSFDDIPVGTTVQVQVAIWEAPEPGQPATCPEDIFDLQGIPLDRTPQPAFGGVAFIEAGTDPVAEVSLACRQPDLVNKSECLRTNRVTVRVDDMQSLVPVRIEDAPSLNVAVGEPRLDTEQDPPRWVIGPTDSFQMELVQPSPIPPVWNREDVPSFEESACVLVAGDVAQPTTAVACTTDLGLEPDGRVDLDGLVLPESVLAQLLAAASIAGFPAEGLVIGRVVDHLGAPLSNVVVMPVPAGDVEVLYVDDLRANAAATGPTSSDGFFISRNAPFGTRWEANHIVDDRVQAGIFHAGLIAGKVSVVVIAMTAP